MYKDFRGKIEEIDNRLVNLQKAEDNYYLTTNYLLQLANKAYDLFVGSEIEEKRQPLKLTLQNLTLEGKKVQYDWINPFDKIAFYAFRQLWLAVPLGLRITISSILKTFDDIVQVELMKTRWVEIKNLQNRLSLNNSAQVYT